ncbi:LysR family transcriptional regulator [Kiloniella sp. EL199]|uniref:LysR family transcriptional regulator n=1 Tax=Kiloniella sp. EL199 TaxID=2107581 RepID=UPI000EA23450|nr:LysR family transcriptional regulator [Kiloniella sp. EL199]
MHYNAMAIFVHVVQAKSFTKAAKELSLPLSTLSRKITELEKSLETKLLTRTTRSVELTDIGKIYYRHCQEGFALFNFANQTLRQHRSTEQGQLHISVPPNLAEPLFLPVIKIFQNQYKQAQVNVSISERLLNFNDDNLDLSFRVAPPDNDNHIVVSLLKYRHILVAAPSYLATKSSIKQPSDLKKHSLIGFGFHNKPELTWRLKNNQNTYEHSFSPNFSINDYMGVLEAAKLGMGIAEAPSILCSEKIDAGDLVKLLPSWRFPEITLFAVHQGPQSLSRLARLFLNLCKDQFQIRRHELTIK